MMTLKLNQMVGMLNLHCYNIYISKYLLPFLKVNYSHFGLCVNVLILFSGLLYLPEIKYRRILNESFGPGGWALLPRGESLQFQVC